MNDDVARTSEGPADHGFSRRTFLRGAGAALGVAAIGGDVAFLEACGGSSQQPSGPKVSVPGPRDASGQLVMWGFNSTDPLNITANSRFRAFQQKFPNVTIQSTPGGVDAQKFLAAVAAGSPPDLIYVGRPDITSYASRGAVVALEAYVQASGLDVSQFRDAAKNEVTVDGKLYGIPEFTNVDVVFLNNRALQEAGVKSSDIDIADWEKMASINKKLTLMAGGKPQRVGFDPYVPDHFPLWAAANGGAILSSDGKKAVMDSSQNVQALEYAGRLREAYGGQQAYTAFQQSWDIFGANNPFKQDQLGVWVYPQFFMTQMGKVTPDVEFTIIPFLDHKDRKPLTYMTGSAWAIPKGARNPGLAFAMARFMTDPDTWVLSAKANVASFTAPRQYAGTYTANRVADQRIFKEVYKSTGNKSFDDGVRTVLSVQEHAVILPPSRAGKEVTDAFTQGCASYLLGKTSAQAALRDANQKAQQAVAAG
jgi:multiple sugar transport system substrate-binding protein